MMMMMMMMMGKGEGRGGEGGREGKRLLPFLVQCLDPLDEIRLQHLQNAAVYFRSCEAVEI